MIKKVKIEQDKVKDKWITNELENTIESVSYEYYTKFINASKFFDSKVKTEYKNGVKVVTDINTSPCKTKRIVTQFTIDL